MDHKEYTLDDLEDIIREYSTQPLPEETPDISADTIRLGDLQQGAEKTDLQDTKPLPDLDGDMRFYHSPSKEKAAPFSENWEPEYDAPMGSYQPQQPIVFPPKNRLQLLQQKLQQEPEKRYADLSEAGLGRLQAGLFLNLMIFLTAAATSMLYYRMEQPQLQLLVFGQLLAVLLSALVGYRRILEGVSDLLQRKFRLRTLLAVNLGVCCIDGVLCLFNNRLPFGAVFSLQMLMAQWSAYQQRQTEISQMDTLRKAQELIAVVKTEDYYDGLPAYQSTEGHSEDFMDHYQQESAPEKAMAHYVLGAMGAGLILAVVAGILHGASVGVRVFAASLLVAMPASGFVTIQRPMAVLEKRMQKLGTVLCGWRGIQAIDKMGVYPVSHEDLFPGAAAKLNGVRFYGEMSPDTVVAYTAALMDADAGSLAAPFAQLRAGRNARKCRVEDFAGYPDGIGGLIEGIEVLVGTLDFMRGMQVEIPEGTRLPQAVYTAINGTLSGVFVVAYHRSKSAAAGLRTLCGCRNAAPILVDCDFMMTGAFLQRKLEVNTERMIFPDCLTRIQLSEIRPRKNASVIALTTRNGLAQKAFAITGGAMLRRTWLAGAAIHVLGGVLGLLAVGVLSIVGATELLESYNLLLYGCIWMVPGLMVAEWTRHL